jgi:hypothetical protein
MADFVAGAIMLGCFGVALFFLRSWQRTGDRLFGYLALSFTLLSLERWVLVLLSREHHLRYFVYLIRLAAFLVIILAIVDKSRSQNDKDGHT